METFTCFQCGLTKEQTTNSGTGYGIDKDNNKICYACCGVNDSREQVSTEYGAPMGRNNVGTEPITIVSGRNRSLSKLIDFKSLKQKRAAEARAAVNGMNLKRWIEGLIEKALK